MNDIVDTFALCLDLILRFVCVGEIDFLCVFRNYRRCVYPPQEFREDMGVDLRHLRCSRTLPKRRNPDSAVRRQPCSHASQTAPPRQLVFHPHILSIGSSRSSAFIHDEIAIILYRENLSRANHTALESYMNITVANKLECLYSHA